MTFPPVIDLTEIRRQRERDARAIPVKVIRDVDPENANRSHYFIVSEHHHAVQSAIDSLIAEVETFGNGYGEFTRPRRHDGLWFAVGEVVVRPDVVSEFWK